MFGSEMTSITLSTRASGISLLNMVKSSWDTVGSMVVVR